MRGSRKKIFNDNILPGNINIKNIGVYLMIGLPNQTPEEVYDAIRLVKSLGAQPKLNEYSPIPGTEDFELEKKLTDAPIEEEPLWHNNTLLAYRSKIFKKNIVDELKTFARQK